MVHEKLEPWQLDFEWLRVQHIVQKSLRQTSLPDLNMVLMMIGVQELGRWKKKWTKEEKQDLMHIGVCVLLLQEGYYAFAGRDEDGWPHFEQVLEMPKIPLDDQESLLKNLSIVYFKALEAENGGWGDLGIE